MKKRLAKSMLTFAATISLLFSAACGASPASSQAVESSNSSNPSSSESASSSAAADSAVAPDKELSAYISWGDDEIPTYAEAFEKDTGIKLNYVRLSAGEMTARLIAEKENPQASIIVGGGSENVIVAANQNLLQPYASPELANIPEQYHDANSYWSPVAVATLCFVVNTDWFSEHKIDYPKTWDDLLNPEFKGMIMMAHPSTSGVSSNILSSMMQLKGDDAAWDYFAKLKDNVPYFAKASSSCPSGVSLGEAAIGLTVEGDAMKYKAQGYPVEIVIPNPTFLDVNTVAIVNNITPGQKAAAKIFVDWQLSVQGQEAFINSGSYRLPVNVNAKVSEGLTALNDITVEQIDRTESGARRTELIEAFSKKIEGTGNLK